MLRASQMAGGSALQAVAGMRLGCSLFGTRAAVARRAQLVAFGKLKLDTQRRFELAGVGRFCGIPATGRWRRSARRGTNAR